ncbi:MAG: metal ABC transporter ATP-binding protein [Desulfurococcales archaeon]|nr:metal ABC transporter ATP-binding protein [Desulfurococcales archaeon]
MAHSLAIRLAGVTVAYNSKVALDSVTLNLEGPGLVQILGPNGAGKTTLLKTIMGAVRPVRGKVVVEVGGKPWPGNTYDLVGYVPQYFDPPPTNPMTVYEFVEASTRLRMPVSNGKPVHEVVERALESCKIPPEMYGYKLSELSGGILKRVLLARAIAFEPQILLLDEPFTFLDPAASRALAGLIERYSKRALVLVTTHDPSILYEATRKLVVLNKRLIAAGSPHQVLSSRELWKTLGQLAGDQTWMGPTGE